MVTNKQKIPDPKRIITIAWIVLFFLSVLLVISIDNLRIAFSKERFSLSREAEFSELGTRLLNSVEFLSNQVRKFVVTLNPIDLQKYWDEIEVRRTRENVLERLKILHASREEIKFLYEAKINSDQLVETEIRSMKLILEALGVPKEAMHHTIKAYKLNLEDKNLNNNDKITKARELMFNKNYDNNRKTILIPILQFQKTLKERMINETMNARNKTDRIYVYVVVLSTAILILIIGIIWMRHYSHPHL